MDLGLLDDFISADVVVTIDEVSLAWPTIGCSMDSSFREEKLVDSKMSIRLSRAMWFIL